MFVVKFPQFTLQPRLFKKAAEIFEALQAEEEKIMSINMQGIVDGFTKEYFVCSSVSFMVNSKKSNVADIRATSV